jgi:tetratricopeptide (TPR) repeat protein
MARYPVQENTRQLIAQADQYFYSGNRLPAIRLYNQALSIEPECIYALVQRGLALQEEDRVDEAKKDYDFAISLDPKYGPAYYGRGWARHWGKDYLGELEDARKGYQLEPGNPGGYLRRIGAALEGLRRFEEALEYYTKAIHLNPRDKGTIYNQANCFIEMGDFARALDDLNRALELDPDWDWALSRRAYVFEKTGRFKEALQEYKLALKYNPKYRPAITGRERILAAKTRQKIPDFLQKLLRKK